MNQMLNKEYFIEKQYKNIGENTISIFDVVINTEQCGKYKKDGVLCNQCFNQALIEKMGSLSSLERLDFINHQINLYTDHIDYLRRLDALINDNEDEFGSFGYSTVLEFRKIIQAGIKQLNNNELEEKPQAQNIEEFINGIRISELEKLKNINFDLSRLIQICKEINYCFKNGCYISVIMLSRAILDHVPPIFEQKDFNNVCGQYGSKSFKEHMTHLNSSLRKIADSYLHTHIRKKESIPTLTQVNFSQDMDVLLAEVIRKLNE
jgi:hypothetical protein